MKSTSWTYSNVFRGEASYVTGHLFHCWRALLEIVPYVKSNSAFLYVIYGWAINRFLFYLELFIELPCESLQLLDPSLVSNYPVLQLTSTGMFLRCPGKLPDGRHKASFFLFYSPIASTVNLVLSWKVPALK